MGRVRTKEVRNGALKLISLFKDKFNNNFNNNKLIVKQYVKEKKVRNKIAGYITFLYKKRKVEEALIKYKRSI
ncbi:MAG: 30S ribosomal protein S17e [Candidatus Parvarchaeota archaeon]|nr:30S ribosomal protein S17e [Candidatus Rehaiarchaeum fermentans]